jgi:hypothetical protein
MLKVFGLFTDAGKVTMPAENEKEAEEKTRRAVPSIKKIGTIWEMSELEVAESEILSLQQQIAVMGANDYELPTINNILAALRVGTIEPDDAVRQVQQIKDSKQDYH